MEERMARLDPDRGLNYLKSKLTPLIEGPDGIESSATMPTRIQKKRIARWP
jgi:hypothetical protein